MFKYLIIFILLLNQLLAINSIETKDNPIVLCVCEHGNTISLENGTCNCQNNLDQLETKIKETIIKKKIMLCFELPITSGAVATKYICPFDFTLNFKSFDFPNKKSDIFYFLSKLEYFTIHDFLFDIVYTLPIRDNLNAPRLIFISQPLANLRC